MYVTTKGFICFTFIFNTLSSKAEFKQKVQFTLSIIVICRLFVKQMMIILCFILSIVHIAIMVKFPFVVFQFFIKD